MIGILVRRGADFAAAEDAVQEALVEAVRTWPDDPPRDPKGWLVTVAWRRFLDATRSESARRRREDVVEEEPAPGAVTAYDEELQLYFLCAHPSLTASSAVALTLRAVGGLTTRQIAEAYLVPEATMAQRISRAKRTVALHLLPEEPREGRPERLPLPDQAREGRPGRLPLPEEPHEGRAERQPLPEEPREGRPGRLPLPEEPREGRAVRHEGRDDVATVLRVLYLVFNEGYSGDVDLAAEAIRLTRQLAAAVDHPEVAGLLCLMLLHHARRPARTTPDGRLVPLAEQDRSLWDTALIADAVELLQLTLARDQLGDYQAQAAIAALHADARSAEETDWPQVVEWYDELLALTDNPVARLNRAVAVGEAQGPRAGLAALAELDPSLPRHTAATAYLTERAGDLPGAARLYAAAADLATSQPERDHLLRRAAQVSAHSETIDGATS